MDKEIEPPAGIPPKAKQMFKGVIFDVWHWGQEMYDGTTTTFERLKRPDTVEVIATVGDKIILVDQEQPAHGRPLVCLPGGRTDQSDDLLSEAKRELLEETGYASEDWQLWRSVKPYNKIVWQIHHFLARNCRLVQSQSLDSGEKIKTKLVSFDDFLMLSEDPNFWETDLKIFLFEMRLHPEKRDEFRTLLFPD